MEEEQPYLGDLLTMVINHLQTGMILQVYLEPVNFLYFVAFNVSKSGLRSNPKRGQLGSWYTYIYIYTCVCDIHTHTYIYTVYIKAFVEIWFGCGPAQQQWERKAHRDLQTKKCNNPGGHCYWEGAAPKIWYIFLANCWYCRYYCEI